MFVHAYSVIPDMSGSILCMASTTVKSEDVRFLCPRTKSLIHRTEQFTSIRTSYNGNRIKSFVHLFFVS